MKHFNKQKGVSLYIAIMIIAILLAIVLGAGAILLGQLKVIKGMENSIMAFYAADSGIEEVLMDRQNPSSLSGSLDNGASYDVEVTLPGEVAVLIIIVFVLLVNMVEPKEQLRLFIRIMNYELGIMNTTKTTTK